MTKFERRRYFERLCELRALYALRGDDDSVSVLPIDDAPGWAVQLLGASSDDGSAADPRGREPEPRSPGS